MSYSKEEPKLLNTIWILVFVVGEIISEIKSDSIDPTNKGLSIEENEKRLLRNALLQAGGNKTKAAEMMGISRRTLHRKLSRWPELAV